MRRTRVLIIDDHENVRAALLAKLKRDPDLLVMGTGASNGRDMEEALKCEPDVAVVEVKRGDGNGVAICRRIIRERPSTRVLILTSYPDERERQEVQALGAAYLLKDLDVQELLRQIKVPPAGGTEGRPSGE